MRISDWSSDVCSSDLGLPQAAAGLAGSAAHSRATGRGHQQRRRADEARRPLHRRHAIVTAGRDPDGGSAEAGTKPAGVERGSSVERRVGEECVSTCRSRWATLTYKKNTYYKYI